MAEEERGRGEKTWWPGQGGRKEDAGGDRPNIMNRHVMRNEESEIRGRKEGFASQDKNVCWLWACPGSHWKDVRRSI